MENQRSNQRVEFNFCEKYAPLWQDLPFVRYFLITGGRGSGKSYAISTHISSEIAKDQFFNILYLRQTLVSAHVSIIPEFAEKTDLMGYGGFVTKNKTEVRNLRTGSRIYFRGIQTSRGSNEAQLKSIKDIATVLIDEAQELVDEKAFDRIDYSLRDRQRHNRVILSLNPTNKSHWIYQRFFKEKSVPDEFCGIIGDTCYIHTTYLDNLDNLDAKFIQIARDCENKDPAKYRNIFMGHWSGDNEGALWTEAMINPYRVATAPYPLDRVVVAIDPAVTNTKKSDETGIVVAGSKRIAGAMHYYVLADRSMKASPASWAAAGVNAYNEFEADRMVAEANNGGDLVALVLKNAGQRVALKIVHASRGKIVRAEPVAALYEKGLVHHVGFFGALEDQMRNYCGYDSENSPDRMDALVWALTELMSKRGSGFVE